MQYSFRTTEHSTIEVNTSLFLENGELRIYSDVQKRGYFQIRANGAKLVFQAGGFVGLIPVNESIIFEVAPRTPIRNLDHMLRVARAEPAVIQRLTRLYADTNETLPLLSVLADELIEAVRHIGLEGRVKEYRRGVATAPPRSGRILVNDTLLHRAAHPASINVVTSRYERTSNHELNAVIKLAIEVLYSELTRKDSKKFRGQRLALNTAWQLFSNVESRLATARAISSIRRRIPALTSVWQRRALSISYSILSGLTPSMNESWGELSLSSLVYNLSFAFESYIRNTLLKADPEAVLDGNNAPPSGAKIPLISNAMSVELSRVAATPDIVLRTGEKFRCVMDVKYKPFSRTPSREDINQVLTYALSYGVSQAVLICPAHSDECGLFKLGTVGDKELYVYAFNLSANDIPAQEKMLTDSLLDLPLSQTQ